MSAVVKCCISCLDVAPVDQVTCVECGFTAHISNALQNMWKVEGEVICFRCHEDLWPDMRGSEAWV